MIGYTTPRDAIDADTGKPLASVVGLPLRAQSGPPGARAGVPTASGYLCGCKADYGKGHSSSGAAGYLRGRGADAAVVLVIGAGAGAGQPLRAQSERGRNGTLGRRDRATSARAERTWQLPPWCRCPAGYLCGRRADIAVPLALSSTYGQPPQARGRRGDVRRPQHGGRATSAGAERTQSDTSATSQTLGYLCGCRADMFRRYGRYGHDGLPLRGQSGPALVGRAQSGDRAASAGTKRTPGSWHNVSVGRATSADAERTRGSRRRGSEGTGNLRGRGADLRDLR